MGFLVGPYTGRAPVSKPEVHRAIARGIARAIAQRHHCAEFLLHSDWTLTAGSTGFLGVSGRLGRRHSREESGPLCSEFLQKALFAAVEDSHQGGKTVSPVGLGPTLAHSEWQMREIYSVHSRADMREGSFSR